jgi:hypothetical protein
MKNADRLADALAAIDGWDARHAAAAVVGLSGVLASHGARTAGRR